MHRPLWTCCIAPLSKTLKNARESLHFDECMTLVPSTGCEEAGSKHFLTLTFTKTSPMNGLYLRLIKFKLHVHSFFFFRGNVEMLGIGTGEYIILQKVPSKKEQRSAKNIRMQIYSVKKKREGNKPRVVKIRIRNRGTRD